MSLQAKLKLRLKKQSNKLTIRYNTFEKATFDQYLVASIAKYTKRENTVNRYIDQITGNGSLNSHFKKLFDEIKELETEALEKILTDSLYPILKIDASNRYVYYPELNISLMKNKMYEGNIADDQMLPRLLVVDGEFHDSDIEVGKETTNIDTYNVTFDDNEIDINLAQKIKVKVKEDLFSKIVDIQVKSLDDFEGEIHKGAEGKDWNIMSNIKLNDLTKISDNGFFHKGNHFYITNKYVKRTRVSNDFGLFLYKETYITYEKRNRKFCEVVADHLYSSGLINTFKVSGLVKILESLKIEKIQLYLNKLLDIKDSKELTRLGFDAIRKGSIKGWSEGAINNFVKFMKTDNELVLAYKVSNGYEFSLTQLYRIFKINKKMLIQEDYTKVEAYLKDIDSKISEMNRIIGEITNSGRRQKTRELENTPDVKKYRKLSHELQGHFDNNINTLNLKELDNHYAKVLEYQRLDFIMIKLIEEEL